jgi:hypothetical protein
MGPSPAARPKSNVKFSRSHGPPWERDETTDKFCNLVLEICDFFNLDSWFLSLDSYLIDE